VLPPTPTLPPSFDAEAVFEGHTIKIVVGFSPGGGYDQISRMFASIAPRHFPGSPKFVVQNLPGSGGLRALQFVTASDPNGLTVNPMPSGRFMMPELVGGDVEGFDAFTAKLVGSPTYAPSHNAYCARRDVATSWEQVIAEGLSMTGGVSALGGYGVGMSTIEYLGGPMKVVVGYGGTSEIQAAVDRGELTGTPACDFSLVQDLFPEWIENNTIVPLWWYDTPISQDWLDAIGATMPPHLFDIISATPEQVAAFDAGVAVNDYLRMFVLSDETPDEIVQVWRESFKSTIEDPEFLARAEVAGLDIGYGDPAVLTELLKVGETFTDEGKELLKAIYGVE
jgi:tripartite-type tricarboxylate transporter receptor subunit TctC